MYLCLYEYNVIYVFEIILQEFYKRDRVWFEYIICKDRLGISTRTTYITGTGILH